MMPGKTILPVLLWESMRILLVPVLQELLIMLLISFAFKSDHCWATTCNQKRGEMEEKFMLQRESCPHLSPDMTFKVHTEFELIGSHPGKQHKNLKNK